MTWRCITHVFAVLLSFGLSILFVHAAYQVNQTREGESAASKRLRLLSLGFGIIGMIWGLTLVTMTVFKACC